MIEEIMETVFPNQKEESLLIEKWEKLQIYQYDLNGSGPVFSVDTPPPYVSAAHLHVGHAMSYAQAEFLVRYKRMCGYNVFYPMGFDDNGLPTERYVEQKYKIRRSTTTREKFRQLCRHETSEGAKEYRRMWDALGLSVDWRFSYSTIDPHCIKVSQRSFLELYQSGRIYRANRPVLWDTHFETSLAQADLETLQRSGKLYDVIFRGQDGSPLLVATSRPELLPAVVGLFCAPSDERYAHLKGMMVSVPLFGHQVPLLTSEDVDPSFGTGLMMVATFGDAEDVKKWQQENLETRLCISSSGKMLEPAGPYAGLSVQDARHKIVQDLYNIECIVGEKVVEQNVSVGERSQSPVEFQIVPQWFIRITDLQEDFLRRSDALAWFPDYMKIRLDQWIKGLKYDWNISRQRFYGVPVPLWYVRDTGEIIAPSIDDLPLDPHECTPPSWAVEKYGLDQLVPDPDVLDTWMTSSMTPFIASDWAGDGVLFPQFSKVYPFSLRIQAFEIIRTWLFYTLVKGHLHTNTLPWKSVMISGWGLNEQGKKISKRDLEKYTTADGYNRYNPYDVVREYGADALRYWAAGSCLGQDLKFNEKDVKAARGLVTKLWNVARMVTLYWKGRDPVEGTSLHHLSVEDQWIVSQLRTTITEVTQALELYQYAKGRECLEQFFRKTYCDDYLELIKNRFWKPELYTDADRRSSQDTLYCTFRIILGLYAPYIPFVTDSLYERIYAPVESHPSIHVTAWPSAENLPEYAGVCETFAPVIAILDAIRYLRTQQHLSSGKRLKALIFDCSDGTQSEKDLPILYRDSLLSASRADEIIIGSAEHAVAGFNVRIGIVPHDV